MPFTPSHTHALTPTLPPPTPTPPPPPPQTTPPATMAADSVSVFARGPAQPLRRLLRQHAAASRPSRSRWRRSRRACARLRRCCACPVRAAKPLRWLLRRRRQRQPRNTAHARTSRCALDSLNAAPAHVPRRPRGGGHRQDAHALRQCRRALQHRGQHRVQEAHPGEAFKFNPAMAVVAPSRWRRRRGGCVCVLLSPAALLGGRFIDAIRCCVVGRQLQRWGGCRLSTYPH